AAGDITGAVLFKGANNQTYATFIHTNSTGERPTMISQAIQAARNRNQQVVGQLNINRPPIHYAEAPRPNSVAKPEPQPGSGVWQFKLNAST
ncbi:MAG: hypothetical protein K2Q32_09400, partial [Alphaproteobacteria bacterium]|nr:hypothetical protein [Alphaproteobacteria bacterium]